MGIRFRKRIKVLSGLHINLSKSGASLNIGPRGANISIRKNGTYLNTGIPGTGIYSRERISKGKQSQNQNILHSNNNNIKENPLIFIIIFLSLFLAIFIPFCGGSWWFLLIMPIIGFIIICILGNIQDKKINENLAIIEEEHKKEIARINKEKQQQSTQRKKISTQRLDKTFIDSEIKNYLKSGLVLPAIDYCRINTGSTYEEAKNYVDLIASRMNESR